MSNLFEEKEEKHFYCWVDHEFFLADHNYKNGSFFSLNLSSGENNDYLMFIPNPNFNNLISPFQIRLLNSYRVEYNLELYRRQYLSNYPSRLAAVFLFETETEANKYRDRHFEHVGKRVLREVKTVNSFHYSKHDSSWIDFLRLDGTQETETIHNCSKCYWEGIAVKGCELEHFRSKWTEEPIFEILYYGRVNFIK